uniref:EF-hand domain-containing protein n=1 Tax=Salmonella sp. s57402 TaxID=3159695 RepID=UPI00397F7839
FEALDVKGDDVLTGEVLFEALNDVGVELTLQNCKHLIDSVDGDGDGAITFEAFKAIVNSILQ